MHDGVTCASPGAKRPSQVEENAAAAEMDALPAGTMERAAEIYERLVKPHVHFRW
jgi:aryl-alcohol dehydrogenase-like predicted oxidoreductase